jgi:hypothetical protein
MILAIHIKTAGPLEKHLEGITLPVGWEVHSFLGTAKEFTSLATGIPSEKFADQEFMNSYLGGEWSYLREERFVEGKNVSRKPVRYYISPKMILTKMYELGREIHSNFWVNALLHKYDSKKKWIILLMYPNEFAAVKELGAHTIFYEPAPGRGMLDAIRNQFDQSFNTAESFKRAVREKLA